MNKLIAIGCFIFFACCVQSSFAQISINQSQNTVAADNASLAGKISFIPLAITETPEGGASKAVKDDAAPVATKSAIIINSVIESSNALIEKLTGLQFKYAMMLNVDVESLKNLSLLGLIDNWFGTRYKMGGTTKKGIDCSALTSSFLLTIYGLSLPRTAIQQYKATEHIGKKDLQQGDLVFFNTHGGVSHVGVYIANNYFVHASSSHGVTISNLEEAYYARRFICGGKIN